MSRGSSHSVAVLVSDESNPFELSVALEIFGLRRPELGFQPYEVMLCAAKRRVPMRDGVFTMDVAGTLDDLLAADTVIVPNRPDPLAGHPGRVLEAVASASAAGIRMISFCTGAFTLASAGVLEGRRATTHWRWTDEFRSRFPAVELVPNVLYVDDGGVMTAAGSAAALDLCLHVVASDFGADVAHSVSQRLVFPMHRSGGQQQYAADRSCPPADRRLHDTLEWARGRLAERLEVVDLAARSAMSVSTFHRRFAAATGVSPLQWLVRERTMVARRLLETTDLPVERVASESGLGSAANLRTHLRRHVGMSPSSYRAAHRHVPVAPGG
jgi:AraC family transcriptional regulator, transcriptional activator FtrA